MTTVFEVLAEPNRRRILDLLLDHERPVGELVRELGVTQPAVSKHLRALREAGLVEARPVAQQRIYRVRPEPLRQVDTWLAPYRRMWAGRLDALERHLDAMEASDAASDDRTAGDVRATSGRDDGGPPPARPSVTP